MAKRTSKKGTKRGALKSRTGKLGGRLIRLSEPERKL
jgi:hypothetical protein